jgi:hypothetical protein
MESHGRSRLDLCQRSFVGRGRNVTRWVLIGQIGGSVCFGSNCDRRPSSSSRSDSMVAERPIAVGQGRRPNCPEAVIRVGSVSLEGGRNETTPAYGRVSAAEIQRTIHPDCPLRHQIRVDPRRHVLVPNRFQRSLDVPAAQRKMRRNVVQTFTVSDWPRPLWLSCHLPMRYAIELARARFLIE